MDEKTGDTYEGDTTNNITHNHPNHNAGMVAIAIAIMFVAGAYFGNAAYQTRAASADKADISHAEQVLMAAREKFKREMLAHTVSSCEKSGGIALTNGENVNCHWRTPPKQP